MTRHPRRPALLVLTVATVLGVFYISAWGYIERLWKKDAGNQGIAALERRIADETKTGKLTAATWRAYGDALGDAKQYAKAATAYREALQLEPGSRDAKFQLGIALAQAGLADDLYAFQKDLVYGEAKLAVELFERPETQKYLAQERFAALAKEAKSQAMD
jgi:tetratricopeptide (TPR) repeat protein